MTKEELLKKYDTKGCEALLIIGEVKEGDQNYYTALVFNKTLNGMFFEDGIALKGEPTFPDEVEVYSINPNLPVVNTIHLFSYSEIMEAYRQNGYTPIPLEETEETLSLENCSYSDLAQEIEFHRDAHFLVSSLSFDTKRDLFTAICENVKGKEFLYWGMGVPKEVAMVCSEIAYHYIENVEEA